MSNKDRSKRGKAGKFNGSEPLPTKVPSAPKASRTPKQVGTGIGPHSPAGEWLLHKKGSQEFSDAVFTRLMFVNSNFINKMDPSLVNQLCAEDEIGGADAAIYNQNIDREHPSYKDYPARAEARDVAWKYAENESRIATGFAQVYISKAGYDTSGYIVRDALQAILAKDKISPRIYNALMKRWIEVVGNDNVQKDPLDFNWV